MSETYKKTIAPFQWSPVSGLRPVRVNVSLELLAFLRFQEVDLEFTLKFQVTKDWFDHRLTYWNLKVGTK